MTASPRVLLISGFGINCEEETAYAFKLNGAKTEIVHVSDLIENRHLLAESQILVFPGGFSYGDDTGSGKALANRLKNNCADELVEFTRRDTLTMGICNGFQVMTNIGILPCPGEVPWVPRVALEHNASFVYQCRWVDCLVNPASPSIFMKGITRLHIPVAHGEGNFHAPESVLTKIEEKNLVALRYCGADGKPAGGTFPANPNGSVNDIAAVTDPSGRILGMMPHPERGMFFLQRDDWTRHREIYVSRGEPLPLLSDGMALFQNAVQYFS